MIADVDSWRVVGAAGVLYTSPIITSDPYITLINTIADSRIYDELHTRLHVYKFTR